MLTSHAFRSFCGLITMIIGSAKYAHWPPWALNVDMDIALQLGIPNIQLFVQSNAATAIGLALFVQIAILQSASRCSKRICK